MAQRNNALFVAGDTSSRERFSFCQTLCGCICDFTGLALAHQEKHPTTDSKTDWK